MDGWGSAAVNRGYMWLPGDGADITIKKPGRYALTFTAQFEGGTGGSMAGISLNGSPIVEQGATNITYNEAGQRTANTIRRFAEGDVLRAIVAQNSGGTLQLQPTGGAGTTFDVVYVGP